MTTAEQTREALIASEGGATPAIPVPRWELYRLLADPMRLRILGLASREELAVSELAELLGQSQPKVSRHASSLRDAHLLHTRRHGTWRLLRLAPHVRDDSVVADAIHAGLELCQQQGLLSRAARLVAERDADTRAFFARGGRAARSGPPDELAAYLRALAPLIAPRELAVDVGTGDGVLLEVLAPIFEQVVAVDRSAAQLDLARHRIEQRGFDNVTLVQGEVDGPEVAAALASASTKNSKDTEGLAPGADAVFASRVLHHAPKPAVALRHLTNLARGKTTGSTIGGAVVLLDYCAHDDEGLREQQADLWLGFEPTELCRWATEAGLHDLTRGTVPTPWCGDGPDRHIPWQWLCGRRESTTDR